MAEQNNSQSGNTPTSQDNQSGEIKGNQPQGQNTQNEKNQYGQDKTPAPAGQDLGKADQARAEDTQQKQGEKSAIGGGSVTGQTETDAESSSDKQAKGMGEDEKGGADSKVASDTTAR